MYKKNRLTTLTKLTIGVAGIALLGTATASAQDTYNTTVAGYNNMTPLVALASSSVQPIVATNLPANVGLYALHCAIPANPRSAPTLCDNSANAVVYIPAASDARARVNSSMKVNGEFYGVNPNPQTGATAPASVDCRVELAPGMGSCAVYILGAGRESANPAYMRIFPTMFTAVKADRKTDQVKVTPKSGTTITSKPVAFSATTTSGLPVSILSDNCSVTDGKLSALTNTGTCTVTLTTTGGKNYKPLVKKISYSLS